ncbi:YfjI family protein [Rhodanobacter sp. AS-Z3]|uniref:YfjI family protein n=1 Tax=Rhodanobacter sp. AS-Z3 TaxID=3031330 RepID=UPI0031F32BBA
MHQSINSSTGRAGNALPPDLLNLPSEPLTISEMLNSAPLVERQGDSFLSSPEPLRRPLLPSLEYPLDALGSLLGDAAKRIHAVVQAPAGLCGQSVLAAASLAVQAHADVSISGSIEPLSLWHVTIGASGERKSAADNWALRAHVAVEREQTEAWRHTLAAHEIDMSAHKAATRSAERKKDAAAIRNALHDLGVPPDAPLQPLLLLSEPTMEGLHKAYQHGMPSIGLFNDDAGDFLGGHAMNKDNRTKSAASFSKLWDSGRFDRVRAGDGAAKYYGRRLAMHLMVQPVVAESVLSDDVLTGQGFLARCLMAWPETTIGTREYVDVDLNDDLDLARYWRCMRDLLEAAPPLRQGTRNELEPRVLSIDPGAMAYWIDVKNAIERAMLGDYAGIHAWASKGGSQVARIAAVLTLVDNPDAGVIRREAIERAAALVMYHLDEAARIVGTSSVPTKIKHAEMLRAWCWGTGREYLFSSDALRNGPSAIRTPAALTAAAGCLEAAGWVEFIPGGAQLDGKHRAKVWRIRPKCDE